MSMIEYGAGRKQNLILKVRMKNFQTFKTIKCKILFAPKALGVPIYEENQATLVVSH